ncbi:hypothetical protein [Staphylococcus ureilyticus]|uniref:hypothetical protein n=1 Tax=Staphylococcus ureilyticus TaxID=94138 RepID=UPI0039E0CBDF
MIHGKLIENNSENLTIIFQSAGRISHDLFDRILEGYSVEDEVKSAHEKYTWFKFSNENYSDYYFIEDYYSKSYGWYMFDEGENIIEKINSELTNLIISKGYKNVTTYGSSKGGTAAILYGLINPYINNVFSLVPQVHVIKYIDKKLSKYKSLFFPPNKMMNEDYFENIFLTMIYIQKNLLEILIFIFTLE